MSTILTSRNLKIENYDVSLFKTNSTRYSQSEITENIIILAKITIPAQEENLVDFITYVNLKDVLSFWPFSTRTNSLFITNFNKEIVPTYIKVLDSKKKEGMLFFRADLSSEKENIFYLIFTNKVNTENVWKDYVYADLLLPPKHYMGFDGSTTYVDYGNILNYERTDSFFIEAKISTTATDSQSIVSKINESSPNKGFDFMLKGDGRPEIYIIHSWSSSALDVRALTSVNDGEVHTVRVEYDGSSSAFGIDFYIDGVKDTAITVDNDSLDGSILVSKSLSIGSRDGKARYFNGIIYDVNINDEFFVEGYGNTESAWVANGSREVIDFDGSNDYIDYGDILNFDNTDSFFIELVFSTTDSGPLVGKRNDDDPKRGYELQVDGAGHLQFIMQHEDASRFVVETNASFDDGKFYKARVDYDGSSNGSGVSFTVDGVSYSTNVQVDTLDDTTINSNDFNIACRNSNSSKVIEAVIYDVNVNNEFFVKGDGYEDFNWTDNTNNIKPVSTNGGIRGSRKYLKNDILYDVSIYGDVRPRFIDGAFCGFFGTQFSGQSFYINYGDILDYEKTDSFFIEATFRTESTSNGTIVSKRKASDTREGYQIFVFGSGEIAIALSDGTNKLEIKTNNTFNDGNIHKLKIEYDGSLSPSGINIYIDNNLESTTIIFDDLVSDSNSMINSIDFNIGSRDGPNVLFDGLIYDVNINDEFFTAGRGNTALAWKDTIGGALATYNGATTHYLQQDLSPNNRLVRAFYASTIKKGVLSSKTLSFQLDNTGHFRTENNIDIVNTDSRTISLWVKYENTSTSRLYFLSHGEHDGTKNLFALARENNEWFFHGYAYDIDISHSSATDEEWHKHDLTYDGSVIKWYVDGDLIWNDNVTLSTDNSPVMLGARVNNDNYNSRTGSSLPIDFDYMTIIKEAKSAAWIKAEYENQKRKRSFYDISK